MRRSDSLSSADVASSRIRIGASLSNARAMAMRWRWPPESSAPRSPTSVSRPCGSSCANSSTYAMRAAALDRRRDPDSSTPNAMLLRIESLNSTTSWLTSATLRAQVAQVALAHVDAVDAAPRPRSRRRSAAPGRPAWTCRCPSARRSRCSCRPARRSDTAAAPRPSRCVYSKLTSRNSTLAAQPRRARGRRLESSGGSSSTSNTLAPAAMPCCSGANASMSRFAAAPWSRAARARNAMKSPRS